MWRPECRLPLGEEASQFVRIPIGSQGDPLEDSAQGTAGDFTMIGNRLRPNSAFVLKPQSYVTSALPHDRVAERLHEGNELATANDR